MKPFEVEYKVKITVVAENSADAISLALQAVKTEPIQCIELKATQIGTGEKNQNEGS